MDKKSTEILPYEFIFDSPNLNTLIRILGHIILSYLPLGSELAWIDLGFHPRPFSMEDILEIIRDATWMKVYFSYMKEVLNILPRCRRVRHNVYIYCDISPPNPFPINYISQYIEMPEWKNNVPGVTASFYESCVDGRIEDMKRYILDRGCLISTEEVHCIMACAPELLSLISENTFLSMVGLGRWVLSNPDVKVCRQMLKNVRMEYLSIYSYPYARYCHSELLSDTIRKDRVTDNNLNDISHVAWRTVNTSSLYMICSSRKPILSPIVLEEIDTSKITIHLLDKILRKYVISVWSDTNPNVISTGAEAIVTSILKTGIPEQVYRLLSHGITLDNLIRLSMLISSDKSTELLLKFRELGHT